LHALTPHPPRAPSSDTDRTTLEASLDRPIQLDICRRATWQEYISPLLVQPSPHHQQQQPRAPTMPGRELEWLSNIEIMTHSPYIRPLWASPQFSFGTFVQQDEQQQQQQSPDETTPVTRIEVHRDGVVMMAPLAVVTPASAVAIGTGGGGSAGQGLAEEMRGGGYDSVQFYSPRAVGNGAPEPRLADGSLPGAETLRSKPISLSHSSLLLLTIYPTHLHRQDARCYVNTNPSTRCSCARGRRCTISEAACCCCGGCSGGDR